MSQERTITRPCLLLVTVLVGAGCYAPAAGGETSTAVQGDRQHGDQDSSGVNGDGQACLPPATPPCDCPDTRPDTCAEVSTSTIRDGGSASADGDQLGEGEPDGGPSGGVQTKADSGLTFAQAFIVAHNAVRGQVASAEPLPTLVWSASLAEYAQQWADHLSADNCAFYHRTAADRGAEHYGENLFRSWRSNTPEMVIDAWASERNCWTFGPITFDDSGCDQTCIASLNSNGCGHYTQLVWRASVRVGCGVAACDGSQTWVCNYDPPGNVVDQVPY